MELQEQFRTICDGFILNGYSKKVYFFLKSPLVGAGDVL